VLCAAPAVPAWESAKTAPAWSPSGAIRPAVSAAISKAIVARKISLQLVPVSRNGT
jgi:hypothetical protein